MYEEGMLVPRYVLILWETLDRLQFASVMFSINH